MHEIQKKLISRLVYDNHQRYSQLTRGYSADENILFHLKSLIRKDLIRKRKEKYHLTKKGLAFSGTLNLKNLKEEKFKTPYIGFVCRRRDKYLLRERISGKDVFYKFPGSKPLFGESMKEARWRLFKQATNLTVEDNQFQYRCTHFKIQKTSKGEVLFDDVLILYDVDISKKSEGYIRLRKNNKWFSLKEIGKLEGKWPEIDMIFWGDNDKTIFEYSFVNDYNLEDL